MVREWLLEGLFCNMMYRSSYEEEVRRFGAFFKSSMAPAVVAENEVV